MISVGRALKARDPQTFTISNRPCPPIAYQEHSYTVPNGAIGRQKGMETILPPKII
jgi:hypothetical protein